MGGHRYRQYLLGGVPTPGLSLQSATSVVSDSFLAAELQACERSENRFLGYKIQLPESPFFGSYRRALVGRCTLSWNQVDRPEVEAKVFPDWLFGIRRRCFRESRFSSPKSRRGKV